MIRKKMKEALLYEKLGAGNVKCLACNHFCQIGQGKTGICGVRQNLGGKLMSLVFGKAAVFGIDPVEKKPLFHFLPGQKIFSLGTLGCNFRCANCHNFGISQISGLKGDVSEYENIFWGDNLPPSKIVGEAAGRGCPAIAYTYNEPAVFAEYALETMKLARENNLKNVWVSNGFMSRPAADLILPYLDAINIDIKSFDDGFYRQNCGSRLAPVLESCQRFAQEKIWLEITTLVIPGLSDDLKMLENLAKFIKNKLGSFVPWHVSSFSGAISWKLQNLPDTSPAAIKKIYEIGKNAGLEFVYAGNVLDSDLESTDCPKCGARLIERRGFSVEIKNFKDGACVKCGQKIPGIWK